MLFKQHSKLFLEVYYINRIVRISKTARAHVTQQHLSFQLNGR